MKKMHIHVSVGDLDRSIRFYSALFDQVPTRKEHDYAKWDVAEPAVNFAISTRGDHPGVDHLGIQAQTDAELTELNRRLQDASFSTTHQEGARCCYALSDKHWAIDPQQVTWEIFHTMDNIAVYGKDTASLPEAPCCDAVS